MEGISFDICQTYDTEYTYMYLPRVISQFALKFSSRMLFSVGVVLRR